MSSGYLIGGGGGGVGAWTGVSQGLGGLGQLVSSTYPYGQMQQASQQSLAQYYAAQQAYTALESAKNAPAKRDHFIDELQDEINEWLK